MLHATPQERLWSGEFGNAYIGRNDAARLLGAKTAMFSRMLRATRGVESALELGANVGLNLRALSALLPAAELAGVEINEEAHSHLRQIEGAEAHLGSIFDFDAGRTYDLAFTCGVLIHLNPDRIAEAYDSLYCHSGRYIIVSEYYNPTPVSVPYRGQAEALFKRDWAGELMDRFSDLTLRDYGFQYHRDPVFPADDLNWFLLEKR